MTLKIIIKKIKKEYNQTKNNENNIIYVSPDNIETLMSALLLKDYRHYVLKKMNPKYQSKLKEIIELQENNELEKYKIAIVRTKDLLSTEKKYNIDLSIPPYCINNKYLRFGEYNIKDLKQYFEPKDLEKIICDYSNST